MMMIVLCHFFQYYENELAWWFNVGVQIFFAVSGFLYGSKDILDPISFIIKRFRKILIPYYLFLLSAGIMYILFATERLSIIEVVKAFFCAGTIDGLGHLWFVGYILFCYVITPYLYLVKKKTEALAMQEMTIVYIVILFLIVILGTLFDSYFEPSRVCCYVIGYFVALYHGKYGAKAEKVLLLLFAIIAIPTNIFRIYICYFNAFPDGSLFAKIFSFLEGYMHLCLGLFIFLLLLVVLKGVKSSKLLRLSDKYSYYVYIVHQLFILSPFSLMVVTPYKLINWCFVMMAILCSAILLSVVSKAIDKRLGKLGV